MTHVLIHETFGFSPEKFCSIGMDLSGGILFFKLTSADLCNPILKKCGGTMDFRDEQHSYRLMVDLISKPITLVCISPVAIELPAEDLKVALIAHGTIQDIENEYFSEDHIYYNICTGRQFLKM